MEVSEVNDARSMLMQYIDKYPGIRYRQLLRLTGFANGVLSHHLSLLEKSASIKVHRESRITRYYPPNITTEESDILKHIRPAAAKQIIMFILEHDLCTFNEIVQHTGKAQSTISWHLKRLRDSGIVSVRYGECTLYRLRNKDAIRDLLSRYRESFMDKVVDSYTEMLDEL